MQKNHFPYAFIQCSGSYSFVAFNTSECDLWVWGGLKENVTTEINECLENWERILKELR